MIFKTKKKRMRNPRNNQIIKIKLNLQSITEYAIERIYKSIRIALTLILQYLFKVRRERRKPPR